MAYYDQRKRIVKGPKVNISNKTLPGFALMAIGLMAILVGAILVAVREWSGMSDKTMPTTEIIGFGLVGAGVVAFVTGMFLSIWLKKMKPDAKYYDKEHQQDTVSTMDHYRPATICNAYPVNYVDYNGYAVYGPPAPIHKY